MYIVIISNNNYIWKMAGLEYKTTVTKARDRNIKKKVAGVPYESKNGESKKSEWTLTIKSTNIISVSISS